MTDIQNSLQQTKFLTSSDEQRNFFEFKCMEYIQNILGWRIPKETQLQIIITNNQEMIYQSLDGFILRINNQKDIQQENILINMIQIKQLQWIGSSKNCKKIGKWIATMNGQVLGRVGGYYSENGKKQGLWQNIIENYEEISNNVLEFGKYYEDKKQGIWKYKYLNELIDGGIYDEYGLKQGRWIDLNQKFWEYKQ